MSLIKEAENYSSLGWSIVPVRPPSKPHKSGGGKVPYVRWKEFQKKCPTSIQLQTWFKQFPDAGIGVITGKVSDIVALDFDSMDALEWFNAAICTLEGNIYQETGRKGGGRQYFFTYPKDTTISTKAGLAEKIDLKADGGFTVLPPSIHKSGKKYVWGKINPLEHGLDDLLDMPPEVLKFCLSPPSTAKKKITESTDGKKSTNRPGWVNDLLWGVKEGTRNVSAAKLAGYYLRVFEGDEEQTFTALMGWNARNKPPLTEARIRTTVKSIASRSGMDRLSNLVGKHIYQTEILRYPDNEVLYRLYVEDQNHYIQLTPSAFISHREFRPKFMALTSSVMRPVTDKDWFLIIQAVLNEGIDIVMTEDETLISTIKVLIRDDIRRGEYDEPEQFIDNMVIMTNGIIHLYMDVIIRNMKYSGVKVQTKKELGMMLRLLGFESKPWRTKTCGVIRTWQIKSSKLFSKTELLLPGQLASVTN